MKKLILYMLFSYSFGLLAQDFDAEIAQHREDYKREFLNDKRAPLETDDLAHLHFYAPDSHYRVEASVTMVEGEEPIIIPTYSGINKNYLRYARLDFELQGLPYSLSLYKSIDLISNPLYVDYLFLPFTDSTNDQETYGGGRYLDLHASDIKDGKITVDFNKAYNPYCAYSSGYNCPIPPKENQLPIAIPAGEQKYTGPYKKRKT